MSAKDGEIAMKPWDGIIPIEEQEAYRAAGFGRPTGIGCVRRCSSSTCSTARSAPSRGRSGGHQGISDLAAGRSAGTRGAQHRALLAFFRENRWPVLYPARFAEGDVRPRPAVGQGAGALWGSRRAATISSPRSRRSERRYAAAEEASERVLRHAARELPDRARRRHAGGDRLHHQRLRPRHRGGRLSPTISVRWSRTIASTIAAPCRMRSICST